MKHLLIMLGLALFSTTPLFAQTTPQRKAASQQAEVASREAEVASREAASAQWVSLKVTGITCAGCAGHIQKALTGKEGVLDHEVKYPGDQVKVKFDPKKIKPEDIQQAIIALGYKAEPVEARQ
jgi:mercuric ion binding protein